VKAILDIEVACPVSGLKLNGVICDLHKVPLIRLDNGCLMAYCPNHRVRAFISDRTTCHMISKFAQVLERIEQPFKDGKNGKTQERGPARVD
jgi:hypothetical protein